MGDTRTVMERQQDRKKREGLRDSEEIKATKRGACFSLGWNEWMIKKKSGEKL